MARDAAAVGAGDSVAVVAVSIAARAALAVAGEVEVVEPREPAVNLGGEGDVAALDS